MSGHSKWANIKRRKEAVDGKKANVFSKLGKEITIAVRDGGADPNVNRKLKDIITKAKSNNMPNDNIQRCIQKASGEGSSVNYEEIIYEGFGPCSVSVIIEAMTDNKNRAAADIRSVFTKAGGSMGQTGSVSYMFDKKGVIIIEKNDNINEDELMLDVLDNGAEDFIVDEDCIEIVAEVGEFNKLKDYLEEKGFVFIEAEIKMIANIKKNLTEEEENKLQIFLDKLDDLDDVQNVWHNAE